MVSSHLLESCYLPCHVPFFVLNKTDLKLLQFDYLSRRELKLMSTQSSICVFCNSNDYLEMGMLCLILSGLCLQVTAKVLMKNADNLITISCFLPKIFPQWEIYCFYTKHDTVARFRAKCAFQFSLQETSIFNSVLMI